MTVVLYPKSGSASSNSGGGAAPAVTTSSVGLSLAQITATKRPVRKIACIGDSMTQLNDQFGTSFGALTNINSAAVTVASMFGGLDCPQGSGTLRYFAGDKSFDWQGPGDTVPGPRVLVSDGFFTLTTPNPLGNIVIRVIARILPAVDKQDTVATSATRLWRRLTGSWMYAADALTRNRFTWLKNFGVSGSNSNDVANHYSDALNSGADLIIDATGTNDIIAMSWTPAQTVAARAANWDRAIARGIPVIAVLCPPRGGPGTQANPGALTAVQAANIVAANKGYIAEARKRPGVYIADCFSKTVDQAVTITKVKDFYTTDGVHHSGGMAYEWAEPIARILNVLAPDDNVNQNVGAGSYYNAAYNPGGNLMPAGQAWFNGTGGTPGAGVTIGTGLAAGWTAQRFGAQSTAISAVCNKIASTDGGPDWQGLDISGAVSVVSATTKDEVIMIYSGFPSLTPMKPGDLISLSFEYDITGAGCTGVGLAGLLTVTPAIKWEGSQLMEVVQGIRANGIISLEPIVWQAGITGLLPRIYVSSKAGVSFTIKFRNVDLHAVVAP